MVFQQVRARQLSENMAVRAQSIGATLTVGREDDETLVRLELPPASES